MQGLLLCLIKGGFKGSLSQSLGTFVWYISSYGADLDNSETASPVWLWIPPS